VIEAFSRPDDIVLDPFCGSGSTLLAARILGRRYIGIEMDAGHAETARRRL
jgi:site-specific DNA-methyltransferase (adenine-specific)